MASSQIYGIYALISHSAAVINLLIVHLRLSSEVKRVNLLIISMFASVCSRRRCCVVRFLFSSSVSEALSFNPRSRNTRKLFECFTFSANLCQTLNFFIISYISWRPDVDTGAKSYLTLNLLKPLTGQCGASEYQQEKFMRAYLDLGNLPIKQNKAAE